jgi:hypothetical protein
MVEVLFTDTGTVKEVEYYNAIYGKIKDPNKFMYDIKDNIYHSSDGDFKIIKNLGTPPGKKCRMVTIQFINTGYTYDVQYNHALNGQVKDPTKFINNIKDNIFTSNHYGKYKIIEDLGVVDGYNKVKVQFITTGATAITEKLHALNGQVKDPTFKNINEASKVIGITQMDMNGIDTYLKPCWVSMMRRCNNENASAYKLYGEKGVRVCKEWENYENFKFDVQMIPGWQYKVLDPYNYHLDKDLLQINLPYNEREYSKNTCIWLPSSLNGELAVTGSFSVQIYYTYIYCVHNIFFIKNPNKNDYSYGPFFDFAHTIRMAMEYYCIYEYNSTTIPILGGENPL